MGIKRRDFLLSGAAAAASAAVAATGVRAQGSGSKMGSDTLPLRIGMTDWNLGERGTTEKLELARRIGLDGVQVSILYPEDGSLHLRCPKMQAAYAVSGMAISSVAGRLTSKIMSPTPPAEAKPRSSLEQDKEKTKTAANPSKAARTTVPPPPNKDRLTNARRQPSPDPAILNP